MIKINSKSVMGTVWLIKTNELSNEDIEYIENFNPVVYFNNVDCKHWAFDEKLPSGRWLENIEINNEITIAKALVL